MRIFRVVRPLVYGCLSKVLIPIDDEILKAYDDERKSDFVLICKRSEAKNIRRKTNTIQAGDIMQDNSRGYENTYGSDNKWEVLEICYSLVDIEWFLISHAAAEVDRLNIKFTMMKSASAQTGT